MPLPLNLRQQAKLRLLCSPQYLHGVLDASWHDSDQSWKERRYHYGHVITSEVEPTSRFHCDLINFTDSLLQQFFPVYDVRFTKVVQLLEAGTPAKFYEESISNGADSGPCDPASGHSGLFSFCVNVSAHSSVP